MAKAKMQAAPVTLELTGEEAQALVTILGFVGGDPSGPRGWLDKVAEALTKCGVQDLLDMNGDVRTTGAIYLYSKGDPHDYES